MRNIKSIAFLFFILLQVNISFSDSGESDFTEVFTVLMLLEAENMDMDVKSSLYTKIKKVSGYKTETLKEKIKTLFSDQDRLESFLDSVSVKLDKL